MRIYYKLEEIKKNIKNPVVTIGNFDGVHKGHQNIFNIINNRAKKLKGESVVITFDPHPLKVFTGENKLFLLTPTKKKIKLIEKFNIDNLVLINFTKEFANLSPEDFVKTVLVNSLNTKEVHVGYNYFFGKNKEGNIDTLKEFGKKYNFNVKIIEPFTLNNKVVSSTLCRNLIAEGKVKEVSYYLGRYYLIEGIVVKGLQIGNQLGFPTANIKSPNEVYPKNGVYAVKVGYKGNIFDGACSIGMNPTFGRHSLTVEVFIFDFHKEIYGENLKIVFIERIRGMQKFSSPDELASQISKDINKAKSILQKIRISFKQPEFI